MRQEIKAACDQFSSTTSMGDVMRLLSLARTKEEAASLRAAYIAISDNPQAEQIADSNIGYMTGYYSREEAKRLLDLYGVSHPVFGHSHADGTLTPERTLQMGMEMGRAAPAEPAGQTERLKTIVRDLTKFITSLTRGGSEYLIRFSDDLYYADLEMCAPYICNRIAETHEMKKQLARASKAEPAGRELLEETRDALMAARELISLRRGSERDFTIPDYYESACFPSFDYRRHGSDDLDKWVNDLTSATLSKLRTALGEGK